LEVVLLLEKVEGLLGLLEEVLLLEDVGGGDGNLTLGLRELDELLLKLLEEELLLLELIGLLGLLDVGDLGLLLSLLEELEDCFSLSEVDDIVLISSFIASYLLVGSISPIAIHSEFVLVSFWVKKLDKIVSWCCLTYLGLSCLLSQSGSFDRLSCNHQIHFLSLPSVEL
jgi:hypothetical protein